MKTIILHVGTHKTGSTSLQSTFSKHRQVLSRHGVTYLGGEIGYENLYSAFLDNKLQFEWNRLSGLSAQELLRRDAALLEGLCRTLEETVNEHVIVSNEYLSMLPARNMTEMRDLLSRHGRVVAVYYYRELLSWMSSDSQQLAKAGLRSSPTPYGIAVQRIYDLPLRVHEVFGVDSRFVRFEDAAKQGICNFLLGLFDLPRLEAMGVAELHANESISADAVRAMYLYNYLFPIGSGKRSPEVVARLCSLPGAKYTIAGLSESDLLDYATKREIIQNQLGFILQPPESINVSNSPDPVSEELLRMVRDPAP